MPSLLQHSYLFERRLGEYVNIYSTTLDGIVEFCGDDLVSPDGRCNFIFKKRSKYSSKCSSALSAASCNSSNAAATSESGTKANATIMRTSKFSSRILFVLCLYAYIPPAHVSGSSAPSERDNQRFQSVERQYGIVSERQFHSHRRNTSARGCKFRIAVNMA